MADNLSEKALGILDKSVGLFSSKTAVLAEKQGRNFENRTQFYSELVQSHPEILKDDKTALGIIIKYFNDSYAPFIELDGQSRLNYSVIYPANALSGLKQYVQENKLASSLTPEAIPKYSVTYNQSSTVNGVVQPSNQTQPQQETAPPSASNTPTPVPEKESGPAQNPNKIPTLEPGVAKVPTLPTPIDAGLSSPQPVIEAEYNSGTYKRPESIFNSWVLAWEPTQKVGIVKVPIRTIREALSPQTYSNRLAYYNNLLNFSTEELIDFSQVYETIFLPMSSNKLILLQEFTLNRRNIQQTEITHGSRYFQVFTESFPDFTLEIQVVKFADVHKKVKLFFDNVMKRISETARYGGSLYLYDVLAEDIPAFDLNRLALLVTTNKLIKYRLLPRQIRMVASADDPHIMKISIDGVVVEWETQDDTLLPVNNKKAGIQSVTQELKPTNYIAAADKNTYIDPRNPGSEQAFRSMFFAASPITEKEARDFYIASMDRVLFGRADEAILNYGVVFSNIELSSSQFLAGNLKEFDPVGYFYRTNEDNLNNYNFWNNYFIERLKATNAEGDYYVLWKKDDGTKVYITKDGFDKIIKTNTEIYTAMTNFALKNDSIVEADYLIELASRELALSKDPTLVTPGTSVENSKSNFFNFKDGFTSYVTDNWYKFTEKERAILEVSKLGPKYYKGTPSVLKK